MRHPILSGQVVFPKSENNPASLGQLVFDSFITVAVAVEFGQPVCTIRSGLAAVLWTAVPETAVHKHSNLLPSENEIGFSEHGLMPSPADDAVAAEQLR